MLIFLFVLVILCILAITVLFITLTSLMERVNYDESYIEYLITQQFRLKQILKAAPVQDDRNSTLDTHLDYVPFITDKDEK